MIKDNLDTTSKVVSLIGILFLMIYSTSTSDALSQYEAKYNLCVKDVKNE